MDQNVELEWLNSFFDLFFTLFNFGIKQNRKAIR
jgi:hypothetical protein